jgi:hypothetical protein
VAPASSSRLGEALRAHPETATASATAATATTILKPFFSTRTVGIFASDLPLDDRPYCEARPAKLAFKFTPSLGVECGRNLE